MNSECARRRCVGRITACANFIGPHAKCGARFVGVAAFQPFSRGRLRIATPAARDAWLDAIVADTYHPCGTCCGGATDDPRVVVDPTCRVNGVDNLRVIDAAIVPTIPRANRHLARVMLGEHMATRLRDER